MILLLIKISFLATISGDLFQCWVLMCWFLLAEFNNWTVWNLKTEVLKTIGVESTSLYQKGLILFINVWRLCFVKHTQLCVLYMLVATKWQLHNHCCASVRQCDRSPLSFVTGLTEFLQYSTSYCSWSLLQYLPKCPKYDRK